MPSPNTIYALTASNSLTSLFKIVVSMKHSHQTDRYMLTVKVYYIHRNKNCNSLCLVGSASSLYYSATVERRISRLLAESLIKIQYSFILLYTTYHETRRYTKTIFLEFVCYI